MHPRRAAVLIVAMLALAVVTSSAGASTALWTQQGGSGVSRIAFIDEHSGWAFSQKAIGHTDDGGATWITEYVGPSVRIADGVITDASHGWAVGDDGLVLATSDGGTVWAAQSSGTTGDLEAVTFVDDSQGWAVGADYRILHTADGGSQWQVQREESGSYTLRAVAFWDAQHGCAGGSWGTVFYTSDGGATWSQAASGLTEIYCLTMTSPTHVLAGGINGQMAVSDDGGKTSGPTGFGRRPQHRRHRLPRRPCRL